MLLQGDPVPSFTQCCNTDWKHYSFDMAAGRYIILLFCPSIQTETTQIALNNLASLKELRQQARIEVFIVSADRNDRDSCDLRKYEDTAFFLFDADLKVHNLFGIASDQFTWVVVDPMLRVKKVLPYNQNSFETVKYFVLNAPPLPRWPNPCPALRRCSGSGILPNADQLFQSAVSHSIGNPHSKRSRKSRHNCKSFFQTTL